MEQLAAGHHAMSVGLTGWSSEHHLRVRTGRVRTVGNPLARLRWIRAQVL